MNSVYACLQVINIQLFVCFVFLGCLQMSVITKADGFGLVPARLAVSPHDASQGRVSL